MNALNCLAASLVLANLALAQVPSNGLQVWMSADAGVATTAGKVDSWTDQSGAGHVFTQTGAARPELLTDSRGRNLLRFQDRNFLAASLPFTLQQASIFALFRYRGTSSNNYLYAFGSPGASGSQMCLSRRSPDRAYHYDGRVQNVSGTIPQSKWVVSTQLMGAPNAGDHELRIDSAPQISSTSSGYNADFAAARIGNWSSGSYNFRGDLVQLLVYDRVLSAGEITTVETWLAGLADGPSVMTYGDGCPGTLGSPQLYAARGSLPRSGSTFATETAQVPGVASVLALFGLDDTAYRNSFPLPASLSSIGLSGCTLYVSGDLVLPTTNLGNGTAVWSFPIPLDPALHQLCFHTQSVVLDPGANALGVVLSNALTATIDS